jgi:uncharacterized membrane protein YphA (DoxX/SURF4 family)
VVFTVRIVLGITFLMSGIGKLASGEWPAVAKRFGTPTRVIPLLPPIEIILGALLVMQLGGPWVPLVTLAVLLVFTAAITVHVLRKDEVPCGCFGEGIAKSVSPATIARNVALCALTVVAVVGH